MLTQKMINEKLLSLDTLSKFLQSDDCEAELISAAKDFLADAKIDVKYNQVANRNPFLMELDSVLINFNFQSGKVRLLLSPLSERNIGFYPDVQYDNYCLNRFTDGLFTMNLTNSNPVRRALEKQDITETKAAELLAKRAKKFLFELLAKWNSKEYWRLIKHTVGLLHDANPFPYRRRVVLPINLFSVTDFVHYFKNWQETSLESDTIIDIKFDEYPFENELVKKLQKFSLVRLNAYPDFTIAEKFINNPAEILKLSNNQAERLLTILFKNGWSFKKIMELSNCDGLTKKQAAKIQDILTSACYDCHWYKFVESDKILTSYFNQGGYQNEFFVFDSDKLKEKLDELNLSESVKKSILKFVRERRLNFADVKTTDDDKVFVTDDDKFGKIAYVVTQRTVDHYVDD